jgi:hypothetical protein
MSDTQLLQKPKRQYRKSGYYRTLKRLRGRGISGIDRRTGPGKDALSFRDEAVIDLGGNSNLTSTKKALLDIATMERYLFRFGVEYILSLNAPVNKRKRAFFPIVKDIVSLGDSLTRHLVVLGLERVLPPPKTLSDYLDEIQEEEASSATGSDSLPKDTGDTGDRGDSNE